MIPSRGFKTRKAVVRVKSGQKKGEPLFDSPHCDAGVEPFSRFAWAYQESRITIENSKAKNNKLSRNT